MIFGNEKVYDCNDFPYGKWIKELTKKPYNKKKGEKLLDYVCSFDTETTNIIIDDKKQAFVYLWGFSFDNKYICIGRTMEDFTKFIDNLIEFLSMYQLHIAIYCHNLSFDYMFIFDFLAKYRDNKIFATDKNDIVTFDIPFIQFRCSRKLTNLKLDQACKKYNIEIGKLNQDKYNLDLDFDIIRTPESELNEREQLYFIHDIKSVVLLVKKMLQIYGDTIKSIPLTATGYVRRRCRRACLDDDVFIKNYKRLDLTPEVYDMLKDNRKGGDAHGSMFFYGVKIKDAVGVDEISAYLVPMLNDYMPMSKFYERKDFTLEDFYNYLKEYCCLFDIHIDHITLKQNDDWDCLSKSWIITPPKEAEYIAEDNGRIIEAKNIDLTLNEIDYMLLLKHYDIDGFEIKSLYIAYKGRLPYQLRQVIWDYFKEKTDLNIYKGTELEYLRDNKKGETNAIFGMMLTEIIHSSWKISKKENKWIEEDNSNSDKYYLLHDYFKTNKRCHFTYFPWGNWIVSHSRAYLDLIHEYNIIEQHVYHDTDSLKGKGLNEDNLKAYNEMIYAKNKANGYVYKGICPGMLEIDAYYDNFVHYGSKCYIHDYKGKTSITIAGCHKECADQISSIQDIKLPFTFKDATMTAQHNFDDIHYIEVNGCKILTASNVYLQKSDFTIYTWNDFYNKNKMLVPHKTF